MKTSSAISQDGSLTLSWGGVDFARNSSSTSYFCYGTTPPRNYKPTRIVFVKNWLTKCTFEDGTTTTVQCQPMDNFSEEVGVALCIARKIYNDAYNDKKKSMKKVIKDGKKSKKKVSPKNVFVREINKIAERPERKL